MAGDEPLISPKECADCGKKFVYLDSVDRHRARCIVRARRLIRSLTRPGKTRSESLGVNTEVIAFLEEGVKYP